MVSWTCPHCGKLMHSAWDKHTDRVVACIHCDGTFKNPYYFKLQERGEYFDWDPQTSGGDANDS